MQEEQDKKKSSRKKPQSFLGELFEWVKILLVAGIAAFILNNYVIANSTIPTGSMENTIMGGRRVCGAGFITVSARWKEGMWPSFCMATNVETTIKFTGKTIRESAPMTAGKIRETRSFTM